MRGRNGRVLGPRKYKLPWIPGNDQWQAFLDALQAERLRNQLMVLLAYEDALRSHELLALKISDIDVAFHEITLRPETTRRQIGLTIPYSDYLQTMLIKYVDQQRGQRKYTILSSSLSHRAAWGSRSYTVSGRQL